MTVRFLSVPAGVAALLAASPAIAQYEILTPPPSVATAPASSDPVEALGRYLRVLAIFPRNLDALSGAGRSSLAIGDANAAISFFARAQEIAPNDGRIKAGLASALVQMEQPKTALKLFDQAVALGVPEADVASDRGLARDLRGDTKRAQADYALALRARPDDETTRRLAVSQAIGGDRAAAMATLDPLLRRQDRAAWRVRAFVLALTGDRDGAGLAARNAMPLPQAQALMPFLARLQSLRPGEKAAAVHLGQFPSNGRTPESKELFAQADNAAAPTPAPRSDVPLIPAGTPLGATASAGLSEALSRAPRRRPGAMDAAGSASAAAAAPAPIGYPPTVASQARAVPVQAAPAPVPVIAVPARTAAIPTLPAMAPPRLAVAVPAIAAPAAVAAVVMLPAVAPPVLPPPAPPQQAAAVQPTEIPPSSVAAPAPDAPIVATRFGPALAGVVPIADAPLKLAAAETVSPPPPAAAAPLKVEPVAKHVPPPAKERQERVDDKDKPAAKDSKAAAAKEKRAKDEQDAKAAAKEKLAKADKDAKAAKAKEAAKAEEAAADKDKPAEGADGERYWVQVASGANKADLGRAWEKTKTRAPKLLNGRATYTSPWKASNRLLIGPFKTEEEAQGFVNTLGKSGMIGMQFTSRAKTRVERLSGN